MRHNTIIEKTTSRIALNNQLEIFLKVKQANNADFSFLNPSNELHPYYLCLRGKHSKSNGEDENENVSTDKGAPISDGNISDNPLSGLLGNYSSSSEESSSPKKKHHKSAAEAASTTDLNIDGKDPQELHDLEQKRKASRRARLRVWEERMKQNN